MCTLSLPSHILSLRINIASSCVCSRVMISHLIIPCTRSFSAKCGWCSKVPRFTYIDLYRSHLEERRRKLMDTHLNIIVGQTEQFSSWLAQGLSKTPKSSVMLTPSSQDGKILPIKT